MDPVSAMVTTALKMALWRRDHADRRVGDGLIHHSDAGSQYTSIAFAGTLVLEGVGDAFDNALAETTVGLFKTARCRWWWWWAANNVLASRFVRGLYW